MKIDVMGVLFDNVTLREAVEAGIGFLRGEGFHYVVTPNPEIVMLAEKEEKFRDVVNRADLVIPDGIGVIKAAAILGRPLKSRVPGIEFASGLLEALHGDGLRLYLLGAKPGVADKAAENLREKYPGLVICGTHDGYFKDDEAAAEEIRAAAPDLLFVCLGFPKQEFWMDTFARGTGAKLAVGLGGSLDVFAGNVERAPEAWRKHGLEWAYRLKKEPKRIKRMAKLPLFLLQALGRRVRGK